MNKTELWRNIKRLFGVYNSGIKYIVKLKDINIPKSNKGVLKERFLDDSRFLKTNGEFVETIVLDMHFNLISGYGSYLAAKRYGLTNVPVYFRDKK